MLSIDGLVTGLDTSGIIEGLLGIQQRQIDTLNSRRTTNLGKQSAFSGIEARLLSFRGAMGRLTSIQTTALQDKVVSSSDDTLIQAAASDDAAVGTYRLRVDQLATSHQVASAGYATAESAIGHGEHSIQVGEGAVANITIDGTNDTLEGLADTINNSDANVTASVINDGSADAPFRLLLTSNETGKASEIGITTISGEALPINVTDPVQAAENAQITIGSGAGAIVVTSESNRMDRVIAGVTLNLQSADSGKEVTLAVASDTDGGVEAVQSFVGAYNDFVDYVNSQVQYNAETQVGGALLGERSVVEIKDEIALAMSSVVSGLPGNINRMNSVGISLTDNGKLDLDEGRLRDVLSGGVDGATANDVARLFALGANTSSNDFVFVVGSSKTAEAEISIDITQAPESASVQSSALGETVEIDASNSTFSLLVNGVSTGDLNLAQGTYSPDELAAHLQSTINASTALGNRTVSVSDSSGVLTIGSDKIGSSSEITLQSGSAFAALGFVGDESDNGQDVQGHYIVDGVIEEATGRGATLVGIEGNANTEDLQIRVRLKTGEEVEGVDGSVRVTRGLASRLDNLIGTYVDPIKGDLKIIDERFEDTDASILATIERLQSQFEAQQQSLIADFAALESAVGQLQTTGNFLSAQFAGISGLSV